MRTTRIGTLGLLLTAGLVAAAPADAQERRVAASQHGSVCQTVDQTDICVKYHRPQARGRQIFGPDAEIVRDGRLWDMGANRATSVEFTSNVRFAGHELEAGTYSIWAIVNSEGPWTLLVNTQWDVFHIPYPGEATEVFRTEIETGEGGFMEVLTFYFSAVSADAATLTFHWGETTLDIPIELIPE